MERLKVTARRAGRQLAKALGCARSAVQLRLKAMEDDGNIAAYTISQPAPHAGSRFRARVLISID